MHLAHDRFAANIGRARILGVEGSSDLKAGQLARLFCQATFTDARDTSNVWERQLPLRPRLRFYARPELLAIGCR